MGMRGVILSFTEEIVKLVWEKGKLIPGFDENVYRKDDFGIDARENQADRKQTRL